MPRNNPHGYGDTIGKEQPGRYGALKRNEESPEKEEAQPTERRPPELTERQEVASGRNPGKGARQGTTSRCESRPQPGALYSDDLPHGFNMSAGEPKKH